MSLNQNPPLPLGFVHVPELYRGWTGSADDLAQIANKELQGTQGIDPGLNERLIRYYVTMGVIDRPRRSGKEALFGFRHFSQLLILRRLLDQGLSISNIRQMFQTVPWDQVTGEKAPQDDAMAVFALDSTPSEAPTAAAMLVKTFMQDTAPAVHQRPSSIAARMATQPPNPGDFNRLGKQALVEIRISRDCRLLLSDSAARAMNQVTAQELAEKVKTALEDLVGSTNEGKSS